MSTEAATVSGSPPPAPKIEVSSTDEMSPAEREYFQSRGEKSDGLVSQGQPEPARADPQQPDAADDGDDDFDLDEAEDGPARDPKTGKWVARSAYLRVKETAKQTKAEAQAYRDNLIMAKERLAILTEAQAPAQKVDAKDADLADAPDIDPETDIFGALKQAHARLAKMQQRMQHNEKQTHEDRTQQAFTADLNRYRQQQPAFPEAFTYLVQQRHAELEALGVEDKAERDAMLKDEAREVVQAALKAGKSPAERLFKLATARGFQAKARAAPNSLAEAAKQIEQLDNGRRASVSLRGAGEGGASEGFNLNAYLNSSEGEGIQMRENYIAKHGQAAWKKMIGG